MPKSNVVSLRRDNAKGIGAANIIALVVVISSFFNSFFYLCASWYDNSILSFVLSLVSTASVIVLFLYCCSINSSKAFIFSPCEFAILCLALTLGIYNTFSRETFLPKPTLGILKILLLVFALVKMPKVELARMFDYLVKVFVIICLPGLLYYFLCLLGQEGLIPHTIRARNGGQVIFGMQNYYIFPLGVVFQSSNTFRYCGAFDEPGFVGTMAALLFVVSFKRIKRIWLLLLAIEGFLTFSTAFFVIVFSYYVIDLIVKLDFRRIPLILLLIGCYFLFINANFSNKYLSLFQEKLSIGNRETFRVTQEFSVIFDEFLNGDKLGVLFGMGQNAAASFHDGSYGIQTFIYDYGFIGLVLHVFLYMAIAIRAPFNKNMIPFIVCFFLSMLQRPYVFGEQTIFLFFGALAFVSQPRTHRKKEIVICGFSSPS